MHTFQPYPIDMLDINPFTKLSKEWAFVTAGDKEKSNTMTVSWGGTGVLWGKNVVFIFIRESRYTKDFICVNGTVITICTLCMLVKLLRLRLANFIAILRNEKNPNIYLRA